MSPEKEVIASTGILATVFTLVMSLLYRIQNRRLEEVKEGIKECVPDKVSLERFANVGDKIDDVKTDVEKHGTELISQGKLLAGMDVNIAQILKNSAQRRRGDDD